MAFMFCMAHCFVCGEKMIFNPDLVPSLPADVSGTGEKEPVCKKCIDEANPKRKNLGLPPIEILPGAYDGQEVP
jgi:hypothetical protein